MVLQMRKGRRVVYIQISCYYCWRSFDLALWLHGKTSSLSQPQHTSWYNDWRIDFNSGQYTFGASRLVKQYLKGEARIRERANDRIDSGALSEHYSTPNIFPIDLYAQSKKGRAETSVPWIKEQTSMITSLILKNLVTMLLVLLFDLEEQEQAWTLWP